MKLNIIRMILIIFLIGIFTTIFGFSNQNSEVSGGISKKVTEYIVKFFPSIEKNSEIKKQEIMNKLEKIIRKIAHFSIYTLVGLLLMGLMKTYKIKEIDQVGLSMIIGIIYASTDEIHQAFIPGRSAQLTDVMLDSIGVLTGVFIVMLVLEIIRRIRKNRYNNIDIMHLK